MPALSYWRSLPPEKRNHLRFVLLMPWMRPATLALGLAHIPLLSHWGTRVAREALMILLPEYLEASVGKGPSGWLGAKMAEIYELVFAPLPGLAVFFITGIFAGLVWMLREGLVAFAGRPTTQRGYTRFVARNSRYAKVGGAALVVVWVSVAVTLFAESI